MNDRFSLLFNETLEANSYLNEMQVKWTALYLSKL